MSTLSFQHPNNSPVISPFLEESVEKTAWCRGVDDQRNDVKGPHKLNSTERTTAPPSRIPGLADSFRDRAIAQ